MGVRPPVLHVVAPATCQETVAVLKEKLKEAENGSLVGVAMVCVYSPEGHSTELTGLIRKCPLFAIGAMVKLIRKLETL